jgi:DNA-binding winged helix-turn-helix (wHTH) protein/predicted ATPase
VGNGKLIIFDPFCLDLVNECLWRGSQAIKLRPKAFAVLNHLVTHPGQLVTKEELLNAVWPETFVGEAVLKVTIRQLRDALDDDPNSPSFIETAHRRGYRFIGQLKGREQVRTPVREIEGERASVVLPSRAVRSLEVVGRDDALSQMRSWLQKMNSGERQIVFVTGEAGIGKTSLVDAFVQSVAAGENIRIGRGHCLEHYGTSEAYLPVLEAVTRLCRENRQMIDVLRANAPMWLLQMPSLVAASEREALSREMTGATRERMLREMGETLEALAADAPLVLILEDLHWSDYSTLDLITYLASQRHSSQLMLIGTYRTVELVLSGHPLKAVQRELRAKQQCQELRLEYLSEDQVIEYLFIRFPNNRFPAALATLIHERTEGNPLFMVNVLDYLLAERLIIEVAEHWELKAKLEELEVGVPENIRQMITKQITRLSVEDQQVLEAASISGMSFSALAIASALGEDVVEVEGRCEALARRKCFLRERGVGEFPDGTVSARYGFIHALYVNTLYERIPAARRAKLHKDMAERGEIIYGDHVGEIATELAMHFEQGHDYRRAAKYLQKAADKAIRRFAYREAVGLSRRGLELLGKLPDTAERAEQELYLQLALGLPLIATKGYAATDVGSAYAKARELCQQLGEKREIFEVLWGLWAFHLLRADLEIAREMAEEFLRLAERQPNAGLVTRGHIAMEVTLMHQGKFAPALEHFEEGLSVYDPEQDLADSFRYTQNPPVSLRCHASWSLWFLGQPDQALERILEALALARDLSEPHVVAHTLYFVAIVHLLRREARLAREFAEASMDVSSEHGLVLYQASATLVRGWALSEQGMAEEGIEQMRQGLAAHQATGTEMARPLFLSLLGEALGKTHQTEEALDLLEEGLALIHRKGERCYLPELYRIKGELLLMRDEILIEGELAAASEAAACFHESIKIAQQQEAKAYELRARMSLSRLYQHQNKQQEARNVLAQIYDSFTEGFDTPDLLEAKALLDA